MQANNELGLIADNLNRAVSKVSKATSNQEANDALQRSITDLLAVINQVARGDLTLRGKVTNDALGNVSDSINYMLENFTKVLERVRKAAMEVTACSNNILVAADEGTVMVCVCAPPSLQLTRRDRTPLPDDAGIPMLWRVPGNQFTVCGDVSVRLSSTID